MSARRRSPGPGPRRRRRAARHLGRAGAARRAASRCWLQRRQPRARPHRAPGSAPGRRRPTARARTSSWSPYRPTTSPTPSSRRCERRDAVVTDVGSVKAAPLAAVRRAGGRGRPARATSAATRWPAASAPGRWPPSARLFDGPPWAVTPHERSSPRRWTAVVAAGARCAARRPFGFTPEEHDARRRPHLAPAAPAGRADRRPARRRPADAPVAVGPGRARRHPDRRRRPAAVAADPDAPTRAPVAELLREVRADLDRLVGGARERATRPALAEILGRGVDGTAAIPGKHGGPPVEETGVFVARARPPRRAGPAAGRRRRDRGQPRGPPHRPRPGPADRSGGAAGGRGEADHLLAALADRGWAGHG